MKQVLGLGGFRHLLVELVFSTTATCSAEPHVAVIHSAVWIRFGYRLCNGKAIRAFKNKQFGINGGFYLMSRVVIVRYTRKKVTIGAHNKGISQLFWGHVRASWYSVSRRLPAFYRLLSRSTFVRFQLIPNSRISPGVLGNDIFPNSAWASYRVVYDVEGLCDADFNPVWVSLTKGSLAILLSPKFLPAWVLTERTMFLKLHKI